jgi:alginate O-acetyltransferase complex protein AlgI
MASRLYPASPIVSIGMAFNMLKAIDALFYAYYTETKIPFLTYANFISFIPTFTSGPIFRYRDFAKNFNSPQPLDSKSAEYAFRRIIKGLFKKTVLAELVIIIFKHLQTLPLNPASAAALVAASYFTLYFDLSGYSDIAVGFGRVFGFKVPENFKNPFAAASFTAFWRNWHVSLSDWIREHVFILVMNKRLNKAKSAAIGFFTMLIMSLWHGFNLPYLIAGTYNGALLAAENLLSLTSVNKKNRNLPFYLRCAAVNFLFGINTLVFTTDYPTALKIIKTLLFL